MSTSCETSRIRDDQLAVNATNRGLSKEQQRLLSLLQRIRYGRIHRLFVRHGQPIVGRDVTWSKTVKVLGANEPHGCSRVEEFGLRREFVELFRLLAEIEDGEITDLEVRNGLPFHFEISESFSE